MAEYTKLVTLIAPQWRVANVLGAHDSIKDDKPRKMVWVVKLHYKRLQGKEAEKAANSGFNRRKLSQSTARALSSTNLMLSSGLQGFRVNSIVVLQSSQGNAQLWNRERMAMKNTAVAMKGRLLSAKFEVIDDPFFKAMPIDFAIADCIIDKAEHKTIEDQRKYFAKR